MLMTNTRKLTVTTALVLSLSLGLAGCGADEGDDTSTPAGADVTGGANTTPTGDDAAPNGNTSGNTSDDDDADDTSDREDDADDDAADATASAGTSEDTNTAALAAIATAETETGGVAYEIDDQDDDGTWEVDVRVGETSVEVTVSADGTSVLGTEDDDLDDEDRAGLDAAELTLTEAIELALADTPGVLDDAELDGDDNQHAWEITLDVAQDDDLDLLVSVTGEIIHVER